MLDLDAEHPDGLAGGGDLIVDHFLGGIVFHRELFAQPERFARVLDEMAAAEDDRAAQKRGPCLVRLDALAAHDGKADLVAIFERIDLVPDLRAVEDDLLLFLVIEIVDRHRVGVAAVAVDRQHAAARLVQELFRLPDADLVCLFPHRSEHGTFLLYR